MENLHKNNLVTEYTEVNNNLRQYGNLRFAQLTIFLALTGAVFTARFTSNPPLRSSLNIALQAFGLLSTICFFFIEESSNKKWKQLKVRAIELERILEFKQIINLPKSRYFSATSATCFFYIIVLGFWIFSFFLSSN